MIRQPENQEFIRDEEGILMGERLTYSAMDEDQAELIRDCLPSATFSGGEGSSVVVYIPRGQPSAAY